MGSVVLRSLSVLLGLFFIFIGTVKLTSFISKDLHKDLVCNKKLFIKIVFPIQAPVRGGKIVEGHCTQPSQLYYVFF